MEDAMRATALVTILCGTMALAAPAWAHGTHKHGDKKDEAGHTELGAHVHGEGKLNIAIDAKKVAIELEIPAADIVGFEHAAETDEQKAALKSAKETLGKPLDLFVLTSTANCTLAKAEIEVEGALAGSDGHDHGHSHGHSHDKDEAHSEFHAKYDVTCANPDKLETITFAFFDKFPNSKELEVALVGDKGTRTFEATRDSTELTLGGAS